MRLIRDKARRPRTKRTMLAAVVLGLLVCLLAVPAFAASFTDVYSDTWENPDYPDAVNALSDLGVITGYSDGTFRPHATVIRQQFAKMIVKTLGLTVTGNEVNPFTDVAEDTPSSDPFYPEKYVAVCAAYGITKGKTATTFAPYDTITRAQVLSMVVRAARQAGVELQPPSAAYYAGTIANSTLRDLNDPTHGLNVQIAEMNNLVWGIWPDTPTTWDIHKDATRGEVALMLWRLWQKMNPEPTTTTLPETTTTTDPTTTTTSTTSTTSPSTTSTTAPPANTWIEAEATGGEPSARRTSVVYLPGGDAVIMFGGMGLGTSPNADTWSYDLGLERWTELHPSGPQPPARYGSSLVYDSTRGRVLMFGGYGVGYLNDMWEYDPAVDTWSRLEPNGTRPSARQGHGMVYDTARQKVILFGGYDRGYLNDTWEYDPATNRWTELRPSGSWPLARYSHGMVYDSVSGKTVLFGGQLNSGTYNDTWEYDPAVDSWTIVYPSGAAPSARAGHSMVYDPGNRRVVVFGGRGVTFFNDCWTYQPGSQVWTELLPTGALPAARVHPSAVYDPTRDRVWMFGGSNSEGLYLGDLWILIP